MAIYRDCIKRRAIDVHLFSQKKIGIILVNLRSEKVSA